MTMRKWMVLGAVAASLLGAGASAQERRGVGANYQLTPAQQAWAESVAKRFAKCDIKRGALNQFTDHPYLPDPQDWFTMIELPSSRYRGDVFTHTLVIHTVSNSVFVFTSGGDTASEARGPIPMDFECTIQRGQRKARVGQSR
jgi:hypothetical protein